LDSIGSSGYTFSETYRGTSPASEPETQAMNNFLNNREFLIGLNYHTFGNHHIIPWGFTPDSLTPDSLLFNYFGSEITRYNNYNVGTTNQTLFYLVNGCADDWMYGEQTTKNKIFSMTPEIGQAFDGFWPASNRIITLCQENMYANLTLAKLAGKYGMIEHNTPRYTNQLVNSFSFSFRQIGFDTTGTYTVSLIPVSSNVISTGPPINISGLSVLQSITDSISFALNPSINLAEEIIFAFKLDNGLYSDVDTVKMLYGIPVTILNDDGSDLDNWDVFTAQLWNTTLEDYYSSPTSITDSPYDVYLPSTNDVLTLDTAISLLTTLDARLSFYAKWYIEGLFDYVQVLASNDGINWFPLCGKYTVNGELTQAFNEPVYHLAKFDWVKEEMSLNDFLGQDIFLRFQIITDPFQEYDGFYFDDLKIEVITNNIDITKGKTPDVYLSAPFPNPSNKTAVINYSNVDRGSTLFIYDAVGKVIWTKLISTENGNIQIHSGTFNSGLYTYLLKSPQGTITKTKKLVVSK
jgi:hypothetical protein